MSQWNVNFTKANQISNVLKCEGFNFNIPTAATITGIIVSLNCVGGGAGVIKDNNVGLIINGVFGTSINAVTNPQNFTTTLPNINVSYGDIYYKWNVSLTPTIVNNVSFGVGFVFNSTSYTWNGSGPKPFLRIFTVTMHIYYISGLNTLVSYVQENVLYGCKSSGRIYTLSEYEQRDYQDPIMFVKRSGMITYNTLKNKRVDRLHIRLRKGVGNPQLLNYTNVGNYTAGYLYLNWVNNYEVAIAEDPLNATNYTSIAINTPETFNEICLYRLGVYRTRQYQLIMFDPVAFSLIEVEEEVTMLRD